MGMGGMKKLAVGLVALGAAALQALPATAAPAPLAGPDGSGPDGRVVGSMTRSKAADPAEVASALRAAGEESTVAAAEASAAAVRTDISDPVSCATVDGVQACAGRAFTTDPAVEGPTPAPRTSAYAVDQVTLPRQSGVCDSDPYFRVQPVYAYTGASPSASAINTINASLGNVDAAFANSAARTGGSRKVRWVTDTASPGCRIVLRQAHITTGAAGFDALVADLAAQGAVDPQGTTNTTKFLIFTEGAIYTPTTAACGLANSYDDDRPLDRYSPNANLRGTHAAVDLRCWDLDNGSSVPAHELMHTFGAVQDSAPHAANSGHCWDEYDLMCYGAGMVLMPQCTAFADNNLFDCNNDDYFNTDPLAGQYLCDHWNTGDSLYLDGWLVVQPPRAVTGLAASASGGVVSVDFGPTASCYGAAFYRVTLSGVGTVDNNNGHVEFAAAPGSYTATVTPYSSVAGSFGASASVGVTMANQAPNGRIVISATEGRSYGLLAYAFDPETNAPARVRVNVEGVSGREYDWNYRWDDMPRFTGLDHHEAFVFLAQLPPGERNVCFDAQDPQDGSWTNIGCRRVSVK